MAESFAGILEIAPRGDMNNGNTIQSKNANKTAQGIASPKSSKVYSSSNPSKMKKRLTPRILMPSTFCSSSSRKGREATVTPTQKHP